MSNTTNTTNTNTRNVFRRLATAAVLAATVTTGTFAVTNPVSAATSDTAMEQQVLELTNQHRATVGCGPLVGEARLAQAARAHSADMADNSYLAHTDRQGNSPFDRITATGYDYTTAAENVAAGQRTAQEVVQSWLDSPGHRANIENCALTQIGVGHGHNPNSEFGHYWTQKFANPTNPAATIPQAPAPEQTPTPQQPAPEQPAPAPEQQPTPEQPAPQQPAPAPQPATATNPDGEPCEEIEDFDGDLICWIGNDGWYLN